MSEQILIVDDDVNLLAAMRRQLRGRFNVTTAASGEEALDVFRTQPEKPAVILCDMRMGGLNGVETLRQIKASSPDTVRLMLTGNADMQTAIDAINDGAIFRFLTKPCPPDLLEAGLNAAMDQHRLITAERDLLEKTLAGSVKVLADMLAMAAPDGFARANRIRSWVRKLSIDFNMPFRWQLEMAAMLAPLGMLSIPDDVTSKYYHKKPLNEVERELIERSPEAGRNIITNIPRLGSVANIVYLQNRGYDGSGFPPDGPSGDDLPRDARILKILNDLSEACTTEMPTSVDFTALRPGIDQYDPALFNKIRECLEVPLPIDPASRPRVAHSTRDLHAGQVLAASVFSFSGNLILIAMTPLSEAHIERLRNQAKLRLMSDSIVVFAD
jgi:response regulator RpfG family c-di-GMP phosphodiesterase